MLKNTAKVSVKLASLLGLALLGSYDIGTAEASTSTADLDVSASITANCTVSSSAVAFGSYDPIVANASTALDGTGGVIVTCTNGSSATITLGQGSNAAGGSTDAAPLRQMSDGGSNVLSYSLSSDAAHTTTWGNTGGTGVSHTGTGSATTLTVYGEISGGQNVPAGSYSDTIVATVSF